MKYSLTSIARLVLVVMLIAVSAYIRTRQYIPNVAPTTAIALLGGAMLPLPWSFAVPLSAQFLSDLIIGFDELPITYTIYGSFIAVVGIGMWLRRSQNPWRIIGASLASSILFYLVTNAAVWRFTAMYPPTLDGLVLSYIYAIPFFRNTIFGDMIYTYSLFLAVRYLPVAVAAAAKKSALFPQLQHKEQ